MELCAYDSARLAVLKIRCCCKAWRAGIRPGDLLSRPNPTDLDGELDFWDGYWDGGDSCKDDCSRGGRRKKAIKGWFRQLLRRVKFGNS